MRNSAVVTVSLDVFMRPLGREVPLCRAISSEDPCSNEPRDQRENRNGRGRPARACAPHGGKLDVTAGALTPTSWAAEICDNTSCASSESERLPACLTNLRGGDLLHSLCGLRCLRKRDFEMGGQCRSTPGTTSLVPHDEIERSDADRNEITEIKHAPWPFQSWGAGKR